jgi:glutathione S-transferase
MEVKRQLDVLDRRLAESPYLAGDDYTIADMAVWPWYGTLVKGQLYESGEFLQVHEYTHVLRWTDQIAQRPAVSAAGWSTAPGAIRRASCRSATTPATSRRCLRMITLYDCATAPSPRRARILLAEKGVAHETVQVDLRNNEQLGEAYRTVNPQCTVPALRTDDGLLLTDNAAIAAWLEAAVPQPPLTGITPREKAEVASWNWRIEFEGLFAIAEAMRNSAPSLANRALPGPVDYAQIPELAQRGLARVQQFFVTLNDRLAERDFIATDRFSLADITAVVAVDFARVVKVKAGERHPHLLRWRAALAERPSMSL